MSAPFLIFLNLFLLNAYTATMPPSLGSPNPVVSLAFAEHCFAAESVRDKLGPLPLFQFRAALRFKDAVEPFCGVTLGRVSGNYPTRLDVRVIEGGLRVNLAPNRRVRFHFGGAVLLLHQVRGSTSHLAYRAWGQSESTALQATAISSRADPPSPSMDGGLSPI
jgi:hypothetical protein